jgi:hypothetical protein
VSPEAYGIPTQHLANSGRRHNMRDESYTRRKVRKRATYQYVGSKFCLTSAHKLRIQTSRLHKSEHRWLFSNPMTNLVFIRYLILDRFLKPTPACWQSFAPHSSGLTRNKRKELEYLWILFVPQRFTSLCFVLDTDMRRINSLFQPGG